MDIPASLRPLACVLEESLASAPDELRGLAAPPPRETIGISLLVADLLEPQSASGRSDTRVSWP
jgi:hypothetical protein